MTFSIRFLYDLRRWDSIESGEYPWLKNGEFPADIFHDFRTEKGILSVWLVEEDYSNLERVLTAFAANRRSIDKLDFIIFNSQIFDDLEIRVEFEEGDTPDEFANNQWHWNLIELSGQKAASLAARLYYESERKRKLPPQIKAMVAEGVRQGYIDNARLKGDIPKTIDKIIR